MGTQEPRARVPLFLLVVVVNMATTSAAFNLNTCTEKNSGRYKWDGKPCGGFHVCVYGEQFHVFCSKGQRLDPTTYTCVEDYECYETHPKGRDSCNDWQYLGSQTTPGKYFHRQPGVGYVPRYCSHGLVFDTYICACNYPDGPGDQNHGDYHNGPTPKGHPPHASTKGPQKYSDNPNIHPYETHRPNSYRPNSYRPYPRSYRPYPRSYRRSYGPVYRSTYYPTYWPPYRHPYRANPYTPNTYNPDPYKPDPHNPGPHKPDPQKPDPHNPDPHHPAEKPKEPSASGYHTTEKPKTYRSRSARRRFSYYRRYVG
ncbi:uncharacterized protein LOC143297308 [Babylonia areolata]|uniref:uncharacterized protein LOC143297308 n=1 Tax=Babylonia areolata TaxID=304850 RepID=UPI003FD063D9